MSRNSGSGITNFLSDIVDDIKDFVDDEVIDRGRDTPLCQPGLRHLPPENH